MKIVRDDKNKIYTWVIENLNRTEGIGEYPNTLTLGLLDADDIIIAGVIYSAIGHMVYLSIYAKSPVWCQPGILTRIFNVGFSMATIVKCATDVDNLRINRLLHGLGMKKEGVLRRARDNGRDEIVWSLTKNEFNNQRWNRCQK